MLLLLVAYYLLPSHTPFQPFPLAGISLLLGLQEELFTSEENIPVRGLRLSHSCGKEELKRWHGYSNTY